MGGRGRRACIPPPCQGGVFRLFRFENIIPLSASQVHPQRRGAGCRLQRRERRRCLSLRLALPFSASHRPRTAVSCTSAASHCTAHPCASAAVQCLSSPSHCLSLHFRCLPAKDCRLYSVVRRSAGDWRRQSPALRSPHPPKSTYTSCHIPAVVICVIERAERGVSAGCAGLSFVLRFERKTEYYENTFITP